MAFPLEFPSAILIEYLVYWGRWFELAIMAGRAKQVVQVRTGKGLEGKRE